MEPLIMDLEPELLEHHRIIGLDLVEIQEERVLELHMLSLTPGVITEKSSLILDQFQRDGLWLILNE